MLLTWISFVYMTLSRHIVSSFQFLKCMFSLVDESHSSQRVSRLEADDNMKDNDDEKDENV